MARFAQVIPKGSAGGQAEQARAPSPPLAVARPLPFGWTFGAFTLRYAVAIMGDSAVVRNDAGLTPP